MKEIEQIIEWNKLAGNGPATFNKHLENSMLAEEFSEIIIALKNGDKVEVVDGIIDTFWVGIGTLYKLGLTAEQIQSCFGEIIKSNFSKFDDGKGGFEVIKDETGKIKKSEHYFKPNLDQYVK